MQAITLIQGYVSGFTYEAFCEDQRTVDAVLRNFEIIGEAARFVPLRSKPAILGSPGDKCVA